MIVTFISFKSTVSNNIHLLFICLAAWFTPDISWLKLEYRFDVSIRNLSCQIILFFSVHSSGYHWSPWLSIDSFFWLPWLIIDSITYKSILWLCRPNFSTDLLVILLGMELTLYNWCPWLSIHRLNFSVDPLVIPLVMEPKFKPNWVLFYQLSPLVIILSPWVILLGPTDQF